MLAPFRTSILMQLKHLLTVHQNKGMSSNIKTNIHRSNIIFIRLPDFLHYLFLSFGTCFNVAFNCNGALWIIQRQFLQSVE